ncbi:Hypothetical protein SMAX5B_014568 [Scophthalmus maximus]|uniref:Uncharacterized protein n=1 Tax=Scophthalmus maximus TaxID=52904 RepID=A0A2U9C446_SCOMX|nr:Hypothetical protein SMAX5B_014568 [Scophthalmus maximus]
MDISDMFGAVLAASTSALPVEEGGEVAGYTEKQKQHNDREEAEEEESDHDRAMGASEEKMEERVVDDVLLSPASSPSDARGQLSRSTLCQDAERRPIG